MAVVSSPSVVIPSKLLICNSLLFPSCLTLDSSLRVFSISSIRLFVLDLLATVIRTPPDLAHSMFLILSPSSAAFELYRRDFSTSLYDLLSLALIMSVSGRTLVVFFLGCFGSSLLCVCFGLDRLDGYLFIAFPLYHSETVVSRVRPNSFAVCSLVV